MLELENLLSNQEALAKQMVGVSVEGPEEARFSNRRSQRRKERNSRTKKGDEDERPNGWQQKNN